jgi:SAM-dependent methyltransferase
MMGPERATAGLMGHSIPSWVIDVLATPGDKHRLHLSGEGIVKANGERIGVDDGIVDLSGHGEDELKWHSQTFFAGDPQAVELLRPTQQRFRRLLWRFARQLAPDATVADIAAADAEFAGYFPTRRILAMDLSRARLRRAIELGRVDFAVLADIRRPPLLDGSLDAIVSTNTLNHLPPESVPEVVEGLLRCLKPGGRLAATLSLGSVPAVIERIGAQSVVEQVRLGGPVSRWWERVVHSRSNRLIGRLGLHRSRAAKWLFDLMASTVILGDRLVKPSASAQRETCWLVARAP